MYMYSDVYDFRILRMCAKKCYIRIRKIAKGMNDVDDFSIKLGKSDEKKNKDKVIIGNPHP